MHMYLGIFRVNPLGIVAVAPEQTFAVRCWMTFSAVGAVCRVRAWLVCSSGQDGQFGFEVSLAKSACMTMGFRLVRAGAVAASQLGCFAPSDCVAPVLFQWNSSGLQWNSSGVQWNSSGVHWNL